MSLNKFYSAPCRHQLERFPVTQSQQVGGHSESLSQDNQLGKGALGLPRRSHERKTAVLCLLHNPALSAQSSDMTQVGNQARQRFGSWSLDQLPVPLPARQQTLSHVSWRWEQKHRKLKAE
eukprot:3939567-Rhodomonas_salina.3